MNFLSKSYFNSQTFHVVRTTTGSNGSIVLIQMRKERIQAISDEQGGCNGDHRIRDKPRAQREP